MKLLRPGLLLAVVLAVTACAGDGEPKPVSTGIVVEGFIIRNDLYHAVTDVVIEVPATGAFAGCGNISPRSSCSTSFEVVDYSANPMVVRWKEHGQPQQTKEFVVDIPEQFRPGQRAWVEVIVHTPGLAGARLVVDRNGTAPGGP